MCGDSRVPLKRLLHMIHVAHQVGVHLQFLCSINQLGIVLFPLDAMLVHRRINPQHYGVNALHACVE